MKQLTAAGRAAKAEAVALAKRMVESWNGDSQGWDYHHAGGRRPKSAHRIEMMDTLGRLGEAALLERFIRNVVTSHYEGSENAALISSVRVLGHVKAATVVSGLVSARMENRPNECVELLLILSEDSSRCFPEVAESAVAGLDRIGIRDSKSDADDWEPEGRRRPLSPQFLVNLLEALRRFESSKLFTTAAEKVSARPEAFNPVTLIVPALQQIFDARRERAAASDKSVVHLWTSAAAFLLGCSEVPPEPPSDWRLNVRLSCTCPDCRELQTFARDPAERIHRFRVRKERRQHLHRTIEKHDLDMTNVTERVGSPQTLVCTKDRRTFERRMKQYEREIDAMRALVGLAPDSDAGINLTAKMQAATERAAKRKSAYR